ncbi:hypothetical protein [Micromonospora sp. DT47]|uniref:hypothetical protein n=1 Tax=Micromonospora sp. DT47 TaxID=3393431 RepID=UPI003CE886EF
MSEEHGSIDLDEHNHESAGPGSIPDDRLRARQTTVLRLVAAFVAGGVLGAIGVNEMRDSREQRERTASVVLLAVPASAGSGNPNGTGLVQLSGQLALINAGPAPITVSAARAQEPGVIIHDTGQTRLLPSGGTDRIDVKVLIDCDTALESGPLPMQFSVKTDDEQVREVRHPIALVESVWHEAIERTCESAYGVLDKDSNVRRLG